MKEGFEIISGGKTGRLLLLGAFVAIAATVAVTFSMKGDYQPIASADSLSAPSEAPAAAGYVKFEGIEGEATDRDHQGWSEILSFSQSISVPVTAATSGSSRSRGTPKTRDLIVTKEIDKATPLLMGAAFSGSVMGSVTFDVAAPSADGSETTYLKYELTNVLITNYRAGGQTSGDPLPTETISLNFEEIKVTYSGSDATGSTDDTSYEWDVVRNRRAQ